MAFNQDLKVDPEVLKTHSSELQTSKDMLTTTLNKISTIIENSKTIWSDDANTDLLGRWDGEIKPLTEKVLVAAEQYATDGIAIATEYTSAGNDNQAAVKRVEADINIPA